MIPTWVFLAIPLFLLWLAGTITEWIQNYRERRVLHYIFDGDRLQRERSERNQKCKMNHERRYC